jgi:hypothetical protein
MSENHLLVVLNKSDEGSFGFSLLGKFSGIPHVIYDVIEDSPAAECRVSKKTRSCVKNFSPSFCHRLHCFSEYSTN